MEELEEAAPVEAKVEAAVQRQPKTLLGAQL